MCSVCMRFQRRLPSLEFSIRIFSRFMTEKSSVRHKIEDGGSGFSVCLISSNNEESSLILLIVVVMFFVCNNEMFSIDATSFEIWIKDSSNVPAGRKPEESITGDDNEIKEDGRGKRSLKSWNAAIWRAYRPAGSSLNSNKVIQVSGGARRAQKNRTPEQLESNMFAIGFGSTCLAQVYEQIWHGGRIS